MKIGYKKRHMNVNLIFGLVWLVWFFVGMLIKDEFTWIDYGWMVISGLYLALYFHQRKNKYLTIEEGVIKKNGWFGKKLLLAEVKQIREFAGNYIVKTNDKEMVINTEIIAPDAIPDLIEALKQMDVEWESDSQEV